MDPTPNPLRPEDFQAHLPALKRLARDLVGGVQADDLLQDTLLKAVESPPFKRNNLLGWFLVTMRNIRIDQIRRDAMRFEKLQTARLDQPLHTSFRSSPEGLLLKNEATGHLVQAISELSEPYRHVVLLAYYEKQTYEQIGKVLGCSSASAHRYHQQALKLLEKRLRKQFGGRGLVPCMLLLGPESFPAAPLGPALLLGRFVAWLNGTPGIAALLLLGTWFGFTAFGQGEGGPGSDPVEMQSSGVGTEGTEGAVAMVGPEARASGGRQPAAVGQEPVLLRVIDAAGVVAGARVQSYGPSGQLWSRVGDDSGEIPPLPAEAVGPATLAIRGPNHVPVVVEAELVPGTNLITLENLNPVRGRVLVEGEPPLGDWTLPFVLFRDRAESQPQALAGLAFEQLNGLQVFEQMASAQVDLEGNFVLHGLTAKEHGRILPPNPGFRWRDQATTALPFDGRYPNLGDLVLVPRPRLRGYLRTPQGQLPAVASMSAVVYSASRHGRRGMEVLHHSYDFATGEFRNYFDRLPTGAAWLQLRWREHGEAEELSARLPLDLASGQSELGEVRLPDIVSAHLTVIDSNGHPLSGVEASVDRPTKVLAVSDSAGALSLRIPINTEQLVLWHPEAMPTELAWSPDLNGQRVQLEAPHGVEIQLDPPQPPIALAADQELTYQVELRCEDGLFGAPLGGRRLAQLVPEWNLRGRRTEDGDLRSIGSHFNKACSLRAFGLQPGGPVELRVMLQGMIVHQEILPATAFSSWNKLTIPLDEIPVVEVRGKVVDPSGNGLGLAILEAYIGEWNSQKTQASLNGVFQAMLPALPGTRIRARLDGLAPSAWVEIPPDGTPNLELVLQPAHRVSVFFDGSPLIPEGFESCEVIPASIGANGLPIQRVTQRAASGGELQVDGLPAGDHLWAFHFQGWQYQVHHDPADPSLNLNLPTMGRLDLSALAEFPAADVLEVRSINQAWSKWVPLWNEEQDQFLPSLSLPVGEYRIILHFLTDEWSTQLRLPLIQTHRIRAESNSALTIE